MKSFKGCRLSSIALLLLFAFALAGCRKEDPNPELLDPIYSDLDKRASDSQKAFDDESKKQTDLKVALEKSEPNSIELKNNQRDLSKSQALSVDLEQKAHYYQIRAKRRLLVDRITYKAAFAKNEVWPDPHEYSDYQVNIRLREAPPNWNSRVPKLKDRVVSAVPSGEKGKEKPAKSEE
jgi:hypothetical protein